MANSQQILQQTARQHMLDSQLSTNSVHDKRVLAAFDLIPRENFVPDAYKKNAYFDEEVQLEDGAVILSPLTFGRMLQVAELKSSHVVLDIGCGTGYSTAMLGSLCKQVVAVENSANLLAEARSNVEKLGIKNIVYLRNDLPKGGNGNSNASGKFDRIFINGQVEFVPEEILDQLKPDGRIITVMKVEQQGLLPFIVTLSLDKKQVLSLETHFQAQASKLVEFMQKKTFKF